MASKKVASAFAEDIVIGFGFFTGFWFYIGFDPQDLMVNSILDAFKPLVGSMASTLGFYYWLLGIVVAIVSFALAFFIGKWIGVLAVCFAIVGGYFITSFGGWFLLLGVVLGFIAPFLKSEKQNGYQFY